MRNTLQLWRRNRTLWITSLILLILFIAAIRGMETKDWVITLLRGLSVGSITFLVASGFSLIFGLMDVLNMAHGTFFMIGAYVGWSVVVRPDTFVDILPAVLLFAAGLLLIPVWNRLLGRLKLAQTAERILPWAALIVTAVLLVNTLSHYPITKWDPEDYANSPVQNAFEAGQGILDLAEPVGFAPGVSPLIVVGGILLAGVTLGLTVSGFASRKGASMQASRQPTGRAPFNSILLTAGVIFLGVLVFAFNDPITGFIFNLNSTLRFLLAAGVAMVTGILLGALMEFTLIRPLYERTIYQIMLTLGLSAIGVEFVRAIWGLQEFTMPRPSIFDGTGEGCPAESLADLIAYQCSTISVFGGRVRTYNEIFIPILGFIVLITVWLLLQRTKLGMIVRAGVQDSEMVEALGINVRRIFRLVFALGCAVAALGGITAAPYIGAFPTMGDQFLLSAVIVVVLGGMSSFEGTAIASILVGLTRATAEQISLQYLNTPVLASLSILLIMVIILLVRPSGLFGRET